MKIVVFDSERGQRLGVLMDRRVLDVAAAWQALDAGDAASAPKLSATPAPDSAGRTAMGQDTEGVPVTPEAFFRSGLEALPLLQDLMDRVAKKGTSESFFKDQADLSLRSCVPRPGKIICVGLNYLRHARESGLEPPKTPVLFSKFGNTVTGTGDEVPLPSHARQYDYEAELVAVIGRRAKNVPESQALDYVLGYCNGNDVSARELQALTGQWLLGKTLDGFMPMGPYLVTAEEAGDPQDMSIRCWLNGELRQDSRTSDMVFSVAEIVAYASRYMTLEPGDVISTGTPEGVILGMKEKRWMKAGDEVVVEVGGLGRLENRMVAAE